MFYWYFVVDLFDSLRWKLNEIKAKKESYSNVKRFIMNSGQWGLGKDKVLNNDKCSVFFLELPFLRVLAALL